MEKFSRFNDARSGVNPFAQQPYRPTPGQLIGGGLFGLVKLPLLALVFGLLWIVTQVSAFSLVPAAARLFRLTFERPLSRCALWLLGFYSIPETVVDKKVVRVRPSKSNPSSTVRGGDILLANRCSYVDVLHLSACYAPVFAETAQDGGLRVLSLFEALAASTRGSRRQFVPGVAASTSARAADDSVDAVVSSVLTAYRGPLVVFPEGAPTNNRAILVFTPVADQIARSVVTIARGHGPAARLRVPTTHVVAFKYSNGSAGLNPCLTAGAPLAHAWFLACQPRNSLATLRLPEGYDPQPADFAAGGSAGAPANAAAAGAGTAFGVDAARSAATASAGAAAASAAAADGALPDAALAPATWSVAVRDALNQLVRGSRAVALGAGHYDEFLLVYREMKAGAGAAAGGKKRS